jgi:hypothetical protein
VSELVGERRATTPYLALRPSGRRQKPVTTWPTVLALCVDDGKPVSRCTSALGRAAFRPHLVTSNVVRTHIHAETNNRHTAGRLTDADSQASPGQVRLVETDASAAVWC